MIQELKPFLNAKEIISFFLAPALPLLIWFAWGDLSAERAISLSGITLAFFLVLYMAAAAGTLLLGLPVYLLGKRLTAIRWWTCLLVGFLIGGVVGMIVQEGINFGLFGAGDSLVFWLLWRFWIRSDPQAET